MGKVENDEFSSIAAAEAASMAEEANRRRREGGCFGNFTRLINFKCIFALLLGISVFVSAIFWLPPFLKLSDSGDYDLDPRYRGHAIVASFKLQKPVSFVKDNVLQLEADIYNEMESANAKVAVLSMEGSGLNLTNVVFGIDNSSAHSIISVAQLSLMRSYFGSFVTQEMTLLLTSSLFGKPSVFEVLKFPDGITITPHQSVYPLQSVQISFNFTLNNSILQILENFGALGDQLKSGLHLLTSQTNQEILYISLTNSRGSTVAPPTTVQTSVVLKVGVPSMPRMKQLVQTIKDSPARNLGLNDTVFGKVKQVSLSSILPAGGASCPTPATAPTSIPHVHHHLRRHHPHHHSTSYPPTTPSYPPTRTPQPDPWRSYQALPPVAPVPAKSYHATRGCKYRCRGTHPGKSPEHSPTPVAVAPSMSVHHPSAPSPHRQRRQAKLPSSVTQSISPSSRLPKVIYARAPPDKTPQVSPLTSSGGRIMAAHWILSLSLVLLLRPW